MKPCLALFTPDRLLKSPICAGRSAQCRPPCYRTCEVSCCYSLRLQENHFSPGFCLSQWTWKFIVQLPALGMQYSLDNLYISGNFTLLAFHTLGYRSKVAAELQLNWNMTFYFHVTQISEAQRFFFSFFSFLSFIIFLCSFIFHYSSAAFHRFCSR